MGKISLDLAGRLPALELITPSKPVRELIKPAEPFDHHLRQAQRPTSQPEPAQRPQSPTEPKSSNSATQTQTQSPTQQNNETSPTDSEELSSPQAQTETETETSDTDTPRSQTAESVNEDTSPPEEEEISAEEGTSSEQDELILNEQATNQNIQQALQQAAIDTEFPATDNAGEEPSELTSIDGDSNADQQGDKSSPNKIATGKPIKSAPETTSSTLVVENEQPQLPTPDAEDITPEGGETTSEETGSTTEKIYSAVKKAPLVSQTEENAETSALTTTEASEEISGKQSTKESEVSLKQKEQELRTVPETTDEEPSENESTRPVPASHRKGITKPKATEESTSSGKTQDKVVEKLTPVESSLPLEVQQVSQTESDTKGADTRPQTNTSAVNASNSAKVTQPIDVQPSADNTSAVRKTDSIREVTLGRGARAQTQTQAADPSANVDRAKFVMRVSRALHISHERGGEIRLRLSPPELGSLTMELQLKDGVLTAQLEAETPAAQKLLLDNLSVLKERLAEQQIRVERFDVELAEQSTQNSQGGQQQGSAEQRQARGPLRNQPSGTKPETEADTSAEAPSISSTTGQLNVVI